MTADGFLMNSFALLLAFLSCSYQYTPELILQIGGISLISCLGFYALSEAVAFGKGGPSVALHEIQSLFVLILEIGFLHKIPDIY